MNDSEPTQSAHKKDLLELQLELPDKSTDFLQACFRDILEAPIGFIHSVGDKRATSFFNVLLRELQLRGVDVTSERFELARKQADDYEPVVPSQLVPVNRRQRRIQAAENRRGKIR